MDATSLLTGLLSASNIKNISKASDVSTTDVKSVLTQAVPALLEGAVSQANSSGAEGFATALKNHAGDDSKKALDLADGAKIVTHLLRSKKTSTTNAIAKSTGVAKSSVTSILSAVAPLFMSLLGQQTNGTQTNALGSLLGGLTSNINLGSVLGGLLGGGSSAKPDSSAKPGSSSKPASGSGAGNLLNGLMGLFK